MFKRLSFLIAGICLVLAPGGAVAELVGTVMPSANIPYYVAIQKGLEGEIEKLGMRVVTVELKPTPEGAMPTVDSVLHKGGSIVDMLVQRPTPSEMSWKNSFRKLVALEAKVIVAYGAGTALAAMGETHELPIVFCGAFDPAGTGVYGKNITGVEAKVPLKILVSHLQKMSNFEKLGVLFSSDEADSVQQAQAVAGLGIPVVKIDAAMGVDSIALPEDIQAVLLTCAGAVQNQKAIMRIVEKARAAKIVTASVLGGCVEYGILLSMAPSTQQQAQEAAKMVVNVLRGGEPSTIPVVRRSNKVELTINLAEADALGLNIPFEVIATAKIIKK